MVGQKARSKKGKSIELRQSCDNSMNVLRHFPFTLTPVTKKTEDAISNKEGKQ
jgi:hypothetical protein